jgi:predicted metal-dependent peptidase
VSDTLHPDLDFLSPALTRLMVGYVHISYFLWARTKIVPDAKETPRSSVACTDGPHVYINPEGMRAYALDAQAFILAHEVVHVMMEHPWLHRKYLGRGEIAGLPFDPDTWGRAVDYIVNDFLLNSRFKTVPPGGLHDRSIAVWTDGVEEVYRKLYKKQDGKDEVPPDSEDVFGSPDTLPAPTAEPGAQHKAEVVRAFKTAKARGKLPVGLERAIEDAQRTSMNFRDVIPRFMEGALGKSRRSFRRIDRRMMVQTGAAWPGWIGTQAGTVVVAVDSSGSIGEEELSLFVGMMRDLIDQARPREVVVLDVDAKVHRERRIHHGYELDAVQAQGIQGGGGTDMGAVFRYLKEKGVTPDCCIVATDGYTPWGEPPDYPVLWAVTVEDNLPVPHGTGTHLTAA